MSKDHDGVSTLAEPQAKYLDQLKQYSGVPLQDRKNWYYSVADAYDRARPKYPPSICNRIIQLAKLGNNDDKKLLEIGCGPGTATVHFAGYDISCLEPNAAFCELARRNCQSYPNVQILNVALEEWIPPSEAPVFDLVFSANAFHWIPPHVSYPGSTSVETTGTFGTSMEYEPGTNLSRAMGRIPTTRL
jgi:SAM-dependent methyltransferase